jgi:hypothetical protein
MRTLLFYLFLKNIYTLLYKDVSHTPVHEVMLLTQGDQNNQETMMINGLKFLPS